MRRIHSIKMQERRQPRCFGRKVPQARLAPLLQTLLANRPLNGKLRAVTACTSTFTFALVNVDCGRTKDCAASGECMRRRNWEPGILFIGCSLAMLGACSQTPSRIADDKSIPGAPTLSMPDYPVDRLVLDHDELAWSGIRIGIPRAELERHMGSSLAPLERNEICASFVATRTIDGAKVTFEFADESATAPLEHLFIPLDGNLPQTEQIERLKRRLPGSTYVPSRYAPDLAEHDNPKPVYRVATPQPRVVMLSANEGLWLGDPRCYD